MPELGAHCQAPPPMRTKHDVAYQARPHPLPRSAAAEGLGHVVAAHCQPLLTARQCSTCMHSTLTRSQPGSGSWRSLVRQVPSSKIVASARVGLRDTSPAAQPAHGRCGACTALWRLQMQSPGWQPCAPALCARAAAAPLEARTRQPEIVPLMLQARFQRLIDIGIATPPHALRRGPRDGAQPDVRAD